MQKFKCDPKVGSKIMAILTRYSSLADETRVVIPYQPKEIALRKCVQILWARSNGRIKSYDYFNPLLKSGHLLVTELRFYINPKENSFRKLVQTFKRDLMV
jgi:hypothetical protein